MTPTLTSAPTTFREFLPGNPADAQAFRKLNEEWITRFFTLEPTDLKSLSNPQQSVLDPGGHIYFAMQGEEHVGCCALVLLAPGQYEVSKMAVSPAHQGAGIGRQQLQYVLDQARALGATRLYLETNSSLGPAIHLYQALGFRDVPRERLTPSPYARANVHLELFLP